MGALECSLLKSAGLVLMSGRSNSESNFSSVSAVSFLTSRACLIKSRYDIAIIGFEKSSSRALKKVKYWVASPTALPKASFSSKVMNVSPKPGVSPSARRPTTVGLIRGSSCLSCRGLMTTNDG